MKKFLLVLILVAKLSYAQTPVLQSSFDIRSTNLTTVAFNIANRSLSSHIFTWSVQQGTLSACTIAFQTSLNGVTGWATQTTGNCVSNGSTGYLTFVGNYIRITSTVFTPSNGSTPIVTINYATFVVNPSNSLIVPTTITSPAAATIPLTIVGAPSQTADLLDFTNSGGTKLIEIGNTVSDNIRIGTAGVCGYTGTSITDKFLLGCPGTIGDYTDYRLEVQNSTSNSTNGVAHGAGAFALNNYAGTNNTGIGAALAAYYRIYDAFNYAGAGYGVTGIAAIMPGATGATANQLVGLYGRTSVDAAGTCSRCVAVQAEGPTFEGVNLMQHIPERIGFWDSGYDIVNQIVDVSYSLKLPDNSGKATTNWSVYSAGGNNALAGNTAIGTISAPAYPLDVTGNVNTTGNFLISGNNVNQIEGASLADSSVTATTTNYATFNVNSLSASEGLRQFTFPRAGTIKNLTVDIVSSQPATGSLVFTVNKTGTPQALTVTLAANGGAQILRDSTHSASFASGDRFGLSVVNNASTTSAQIRSFSVTVELK